MEESIANSLLEIPHYKTQRQMEVTDKSTPMLVGSGSKSMPGDILVIKNSPKKLLFQPFIDIWIESVLHSFLVVTQGICERPAINWLTHLVFVTG